MLRAAMAVVVGGYAFGGLGTGIGRQTVDHAVDHIVNHAVSHVVTAATAKKTVVFHGYEIDVPASWPVYRLDLHPDQCVRYDVHAVYLGTPGGNQRCPAGLVGRTETVSIGTPAALGRAGASGQARAPGEAGSPAIVLQDAKQQEFGISMPASEPAITATYGTDPALIEHVLASVRQVTPQMTPLTRPSAAAAPTAHAAPTVHVMPSVHAAPTARPTSAVRGKPVAQAQAQASPSAAHVPPATGIPAGVRRTASPGASGMPTAPPLPGFQPLPALTVSRGPLAGFDTCTAPSLQAMRAWRAKFSATAIYIGGQEMACGYGNLSANWVRQVKALGWSLMPTYVGPQAPCNDFSVKVDMKLAAAQGRQNARWAVQDAAKFGLGKGSPIYYDMEAYDNTRASCVTAILTFLDAWTRELNAEGYVSGVYSSAGSGVTDLAKTTRVAGHQLAKPQAIWFALWDNGCNLNGAPYLPKGLWPGLHRSKQFAGSHWMTIRHVSLNIDSDLVDGAVAR